MKISGDLDIIMLICHLLRLPGMIDVDGANQCEFSHKPSAGGANLVLAV